MKLIQANFRPAVNRQSLDKSAPFSSADAQTTFFFSEKIILNIDFVSTDFSGAHFLALKARFCTVWTGGYW